MTQVMTQVLEYDINAEKKLVTTLKITYDTFK